MAYFGRLHKRAAIAQVDANVIARFAFVPGNAAERRPLEHRHAAVDVDCLAGDIGRLVGGQ
ncbi:MAG: hypothetical protein WCG00_03330, partial [Hyphomicrobiales bacterium]